MKLDDIQQAEAVTLPLPMKSGSDANVDIQTDPSILDKKKRWSTPKSPEQSEQLANVGTETYGKTQRTTESGTPAALAASSNQ